MASEVAQAVVQFATDGTYPENESVIARDLDTTTLSDILGVLRKARADARQEVQVLSKTTGSNVEQWISLAKELQRDIQQSRDVARSIVQENETIASLKEQVQDSGSKIQLLEREIRYEEALGDTLQRLRDAHGLLLDTQDAIVKGDVVQALKVLRSAKDAVTALKSTVDTKATGILDTRGKQLKGSIEDAVAVLWDKFFRVDVKQGAGVILSRLPDDQKMTLDVVAKVAQDAGMLDKLVKKFTRDLDRGVVQRVLLSLNGDDVRVNLMGPSAEISFHTSDPSNRAVSSFYQSLLDFFTSQLPESIRMAISESYLPHLLTRMEEVWLDASIPSDVAGVQAFSEVLSLADGIAISIDSKGLPGAQRVRDWVENVPSAWLTKRRELSLGVSRDIVFEKLHQTKTVQRVETQVIDNVDDEAMQSLASGDDWDTAWDESGPVEPRESLAAATSRPDEDDDGSAWDIDDPMAETAQSAPAEEDAWGWGDDTGPPSPERTMMKPTAPPTATKPVPKQQTQTLSETYTVTAIPDELFDLIEAIVRDAETLLGASYAASPISRAASALYSLPTLVLAIYRATAPTAYTKLAAGNMMIYTDATRLAERLRAWQGSQPPASRLRLDNDVKALEEFARRAYAAEMESQRTVMRDLLDGAQGFSGCTVQPFKSACESAVEQAVDRIRELHSTWKDILAPSALPQAVGSLLSTLIGKMIGEIEELGDISEQESHELKALCERVNTLKSLFMQENPQSGLSDLTFVYCPNWLKFQYLAEILESSLVDIRYLWNEGELSLEFEAEAVIDLIRALFAESDKRRQAINEIRRGGRR